MSEPNAAAAAVVGNALQALSERVSVFVEREMRGRHGDAWEQAARSGLTVAADSALDLGALLQVIEQHWSTVFVAKLAPGDRAAVNELRGVRNAVVHQRGFTTPDALRALDAMQKLLRSMGDTAAANDVVRLKAALAEPPKSPLRSSTRASFSSVGTSLPRPPLTASRT